MARYKSVLLVEDDPITMLVCERIIRMNDFAAEVKSCENGELALQHLESLMLNGTQMPDIVFLDVNMPVMDGWGFLEGLVRLEAKGKLPRIFILSSTVDPEDYKKARSYEVVENFILKPLNRDSLERIP
ncbi:response regulator [Segetibacter sp. 3557_3]|uniref:response regulator n=1 Tax=Segetibacter sp. 3557_3 TaxID=2547429 RepID=UPI001058518D|nr:response regulator [Segetibacter sp. 3557_3]TDH26884.1 response regulator [Segetibacter sp. 3557_3]